MQPYAELAKRFVAPGNEQLAVFLPEIDAGLAMLGKVPEAKRKFDVQVAKKFVQVFLSTAEFAELKGTIRAENEELLKKAKGQLTDFVQNASKGISKDYSVDLNLSVDEAVTLPPHWETERALAYSMILKIKGNDENGRDSFFEAAVTATFVHLRGKVLFLYANTEKSELEWCRAESQKWANAIIAANPSTGEVAQRESRPLRSGSDSNRVLRNGIIGAIVGGIFGGLSYLLRKKKTRAAANTTGGPPPVG